MSTISRCAAGFALAIAVIAAWSGSAHAFRMIETTVVGRSTLAPAVACSDPGGFAHRAVLVASWQYSTTNEGGEPGIANALRNAMSSWNGVGGHTLTLTGTTSAGFATDGANVIHWATGEGCSGGCLALTALVLQAGQVIVESDITFNDGFDWNTDGRDYDVEAIAAHQLGHTLGIHHTDQKYAGSRRPTMYASYIGVQGRSLEPDDISALQCSESRYLVAPQQITAVADRSPRLDEPSLSSRPRDGGALIRF